MASEEIEKLTKLVKMVIRGVSGKEIAEVFGLSEGRVSQIKETEIFKRVYQEESEKFVENQQKMNDSWDSIEMDGLAIVGQNLRVNKDPEFALKAAALANRANRRGGMQQQLPAQMGERVLVQLNVGFMQQFKQLAESNLSNFGGTVKILQSTGATKRTNLLAPGSVSDMFSAKMGESPQGTSQILDDAEPLTVVTQEQISKYLEETN